MKRILVLVAVITLFPLWSTAVIAQTLKIATLAPEGSFWMVEMRAGAKEIEERTEGRVKFRFYGGGVQGIDNQVRRKIRIGQLHGATFTSGSLAQLAPDIELYSLPLTFNNMGEVTHVRRHMDQKLREQLEQAGQVNFGIAGAGMGYMMSNTPLSSLSDMSGQKTWVQEGDEISYAAFKSLGISPVSMPLTDVLTGLQTDLLDSAAISPVGAVVLQLHTKLGYITDIPLSYVYGTLVIDQKPFSRLTENDQLVVREVMERIYSKIDAASVTDNSAALDALVERGLKMVEPDSSEVPRWRELVLESNQQLSEQGVINKSLVEEMNQLLEQYRANHPR